MAHITCDGCGEMVNTHNDNALQEVHGWVNRGRKRGVNQIRAEVATGKWRHKACLEGTKDFIDGNQGTLL